MSDDDPFAMPRPGDSVPFELLDQRHAWVRALRGVPQDPVFHAEGDVWIHTKMVAEALVALESWRTRPLAERHELYVASLLHDVAKPRCTQIERDVGGVRIRSLGHAPAGARVSRRILWELGIDLGIGRVEIDIRDLDRQRPAPRHRVARIDAEIEDRAFELRRINQGLPQPLGLDDADVDMLAERAPQQPLHAMHQAADLGRA